MRLAAAPERFVIYIAQADICIILHYEHMMMLAQQCKVMMCAVTTDMLHSTKQRRRPLAHPFQRFETSRSTVTLLVLTLTLLCGGGNCFLGVQADAGVQGDDPRINRSSSVFRTPPGYQDAHDYCERYLQTLSPVESSRIYGEAAATFDGSIPRGRVQGCVMGQAGNPLYPVFDEWRERVFPWAGKQFLHHQQLTSTTW